jgi:hypothetical protein
MKETGQSEQQTLGNKELNLDQPTVTYRNYPKVDLECHCVYQFDGESEFDCD